MKFSSNQIIVIGLILIIVLLGTCNACQHSKIKDLERNCGKVVKDSSSKTTYDHVKDSGEYRPNVTFIDHAPIEPEPIVLEAPPQVITKIVHDTVVRKVDTSAILRRFFDNVYYNDTLTTKYGNVFLHDVITQNRIASRKWVSDITVPTITKTVTLEARKHNELWLGINAQGNQDKYLQSAGVSLMLKNKKKTAYEIGVLSDWNGDLIYQAGMKWKLSLKK